MFQEKMVTPAIPERVYALCKIVEKKSISNSDLKEKMEPDFLDNGSTYFSDYRNAAEELGLITISDNLISLGVDNQVVASSDDMRLYINMKLESFSYSQFYIVTREYFEMGDKPLKDENNISSMGALFSNATDKPVDSVAMRAWRFWTAFMGFGYLHDMLFIPNASTFLWDLLSTSRLKTGERYSVDEVVDAIRPYCNVIVNPDPLNKKFNYGVSNGLRTLNDIGLIKMEHILDQKNLWELYPMNAHPIGSTVTNITICK